MFEIYFSSSSSHFLFYSLWNSEPFSLTRFFFCCCFSLRSPDSCNSWLFDRFSFYCIFAVGMFGVRSSFQSLCIYSLYGSKTRPFRHSGTKCIKLLWFHVLKLYVHKGKKMPGYLEFPEKKSLLWIFNIFNCFYKSIRTFKIRHFLAKQKTLSMSKWNLVSTK